MNSQNSPEEFHLAVVYSQYDRKTHAGALEQLIALLEGMEGIQYTLLVVDNANPGTWCHEISNHLIHLGGDNSCREFSAFDRGLQFLATQPKDIHVVGFATDAYRAYGEEYLGLISGTTVRQSLDLNACIGWVDSFGAEVGAFGYTYESWIRTSLFFIPSSLLPSVGPLTTPIDPTQLFGPEASSPFADSAPLTGNLKDQLLAWLTTTASSVVREDPWHSYFELTDDTFALFQDKTCAILREQLLSARLAREGFACYDFRLVAKLAKAGLENSMLSEEQRSAWQWMGWRKAKIDRVLKYSLKHYEAPSAMLHGHPNQITLSGWLVSEPRVEEVRLRVGDHWILGGKCDVLCADVEPEPSGDVLGPKYGFEICGVLDGLEPGHYEVEWSVPGASVTKSLSSVHVLPRCEFKPRCVFVPELAPPGQEFPISVQGLLESSHSLVQVEIQWNDQATSLDVRWAENRLHANGLWTYDLSVWGAVTLEQGAPQHALTLVFHMADGGKTTWRHFQMIRPEATTPHLLASHWVGSFNPKTQRVPVQLEGAVCCAAEDARLLFFRDEEFLLSEVLPNTVGEITWFDISCEVAKIPPGKGEFSLALESSQQAPKVFARWTSRVEYLRPRLEVDLCEVKPVQRSSPTAYVLELSGWVENHTLVENLVLTANDEEITEVEFNRFRPDLAKAWGFPLVRKQGFATVHAVDLGPGRNTLRLCFSRSGRLEVLWEKVIDLGECQLPDFLVHAPILVKLEGDEFTTFWSTISINGTMESPLEHVMGTLYIDGEQVDQQPILSGGSFLLCHVPENSGFLSIQVVFDALGKTLYDSGNIDIGFEKIEIPDEACSILDRFLEAFEIRKVLDLGATEDITRALLERNLENLSDQFLMLREINPALAAGPRKASAAPRPVPVRKAVDRPLRVLFASWNVPCLRHGGGVWMTNLLKHLGKRHEITVIYCYSPYEEEWIKDIRPYVKKTIGVPRRYQATAAHEYNPLFRELYAEYVAELRTAIELEVWSGNYDLVDYQYVQMYPHISRVGLPQVLTVFEERFSAELSRDFSGYLSDLEKVEVVDRLLKAFYFSAVVMPRSLKHLIAVTAEDARAMQDFQTDTEVHINKIGIDMEKFLRPAGEEANGNGISQDLVVLGNYHHPPSAHAALFCAEKVLPGLQKTHSQAGLAIVGAFPTPELERLGEEPGITVTGFVEDHRPYLWRAAAFMAPIFTGSGMRVKVLEAMASGVPVIATDLAMHGIGAVAGEHFLRAETVEEFVIAARKCLEDPESGRAMGRRGRKLIAEKHSNERRAGEREAIWLRVIEGSSAEGEQQPE
jgi:glycosyltransferase involved in cell wall biosynthesis